jgi:hypothetical protein
VIPVACVALIGLFDGCDNNDSSGPTGPLDQLEVPALPAANPLIRSIAPGEPAPGQAVTIDGENFGTDVRRVSVRFNGQLAHLASVADKQIVAVIPIAQGPGTIPVEVAVSGAAVKATSRLTVKLLAPVITELSPASAFAGGSVTIKGAHFGVDDGDLSVTFGGNPVVLTSVLDNAIVAVIPPTLADGPAIVELSRDKAPGTATGTLMVLKLPEARGSWKLSGEIVMDDSTRTHPNRTRCALSGSLDLSSQLRLRLGGAASLLATCDSGDDLPIAGGLTGRIAEDGKSMTFSVGLPELEVASTCVFNATQLVGALQSASGTIAGCAPITDELGVGIRSATWQATRS